ncbi:uncharacterized protein JCM15063_002065 [Sporobolomyces koalae]|uniref:uncharacterized protein n=1 Tax=Sporobolomyces koalae TaxID=500713 RepID=UPI0031703772
MTPPIKYRGTRALGVADVANTLYPRIVEKEPAKLTDVVCAWQKHDGDYRSPDVTASRFKSHHTCFSHRARLLRGKTVRRAIVDVLRREDRVDESHLNGESLDRVLEWAMEISRHTGEAEFISPGLIIAPDWELAEQYRQYGWKDPGIRWSAFRPSLLKITFVPANLTWRLEVVDIKSTQPSSVPDDPLFPCEDFKLQVYRYFLRLLVEDIKMSDPFFRRLVVSRDINLWRYTGCFSRACDDPDCILNSPWIDSDYIERAMRITRIDLHPLILLHLMLSRLPRSLPFQLPHEIWALRGECDEYENELRGFAAAEEWAGEIAWEIKGEIVRVRQESAVVNDLTDTEKNAQGA